MYPWVHNLASQRQSTLQNAFMCTTIIVYNIGRGTSPVLSGINKKHQEKHKATFSICMRDTVNELALKHYPTLKQKMIYLRLTITVIWKHALEAACSSNVQSQIQNVICSLYRLYHQQCHWQICDNVLLIMPCQVIVPCQVFSFWPAECKNK